VTVKTFTWLQKFMLNKKKYKYVQNRKHIHKKYIQIENKILQNRNNCNSMKHNYSLKYN